MPSSRLLQRLFTDRLSAAAYDHLTRQPAWRRQIARLVPHLTTTPRRVLDLGCGPGISSFVLADHLPTAQVTGVDVSHPMIARARRTHLRHHAHLRNLAFVQGDARHLPFPDGTFCCVTGHSVLYLIPHQARVLAELRRVLAPGGRLVLMEPSAEGSLRQAAATWAPHARQALRRPLDDGRFALSMLLWRLVSAHGARMDAPTARQLFTSAGFRDLRCEPTLAGLGWHYVAER